MLLQLQSPSVHIAAPLLVDAGEPVSASDNTTLLILQVFLFSTFFALSLKVTHDLQ
jgi:hypothetical protein